MQNSLIAQAVINKNGPDCSGPVGLKLAIASPRNYFFFFGAAFFFAAAFFLVAYFIRLILPYIRIRALFRERACVPFIRWIEKNVKGKMRARLRWTLAC